PPAIGGAPERTPGQGSKQRIGRAKAAAPRRECCGPQMKKGCPARVCRAASRYACCECSLVGLVSHPGRGGNHAASVVASRGISGRRRGSRRSDIHHATVAGRNRSVAVTAVAAAGSGAADGGAAALLLAAVAEEAIEQAATLLAALLLAAGLSAAGRFAASVVAAGVGHAAAGLAAAVAAAAGHAAAAAAAALAAPAPAAASPR